MIDGTEALLTDLLLRAGCGDQTALGDLQRMTQAGLGYYIRRIVKDPWHEEEVLQDIYMYIWLHASEYRHDRGTPSAWIYMLARSRAIDCLRRIRRDRALVELDDHVRPKIPADSYRDPAEIWRHSLVRTGLQELPPDLRSLVGMAFFTGFSHSEIASRTGMPLGTVKTKIRLALLRLREKMPDQEKFARAA